MKSFKRTRVLTDPKDIKLIIDAIDKYGLDVICVGRGCEYDSLNEYQAKKHEKVYVSDSIIINLKETKLEITTEFGPLLLKPCTYIFSLNEDDVIGVNGLKCFAEFSKSFKIPKALEYGNTELNNWFDYETGKFACSASPLIGYNKKYEKKVLRNCYEYDLNSAYFDTLLKQVPNLENPHFYADVGENQIGFLLDDDLTIMKKGKADVVFDLIDTPEKLKEYCKRWYDIKKQAKIDGDNKLKTKAKAYLNLPIGYCQRINPFLRAYVVHKCNERIRALKDENTLFWNTDAIFSLVPREDLEIGQNIGQFKVEKCEELRYIQNNYQINHDIPVYRGIPKEWFRAFKRKNGRDFDILKDELPELCNKYEWDWNKLELRLNDYGEE